MPKLKNILVRGMLTATMLTGSPKKGATDCDSHKVLKSINKKTMDEDARLLARALYSIIYFQGAYKSKNSQERKTAERLKCLEWPLDSTEIIEMQQDFLTPYDPDLTTPKNEAISIIKKRAEWAKENGHYFDKPDKPFTNLGIDVLFNGIPLTYMPSGCGKVEVTFPSGAKRIYQPNSNWIIKVKSEKTRSEILNPELFIPKDHKSLENLLTFNTQLLPCPDINQSQNNYFEKDWNHLRLFTDFFINSKELKKKNGIYNLEAIFTVSRNDQLVKQDTLRINQDLPEKGMMRFAPNWSFPKTPEDNYLVTTVVTDMNSGKKSEAIFKPSTSSSVWICTDTYLWEKKNILDYYFPTTSGKNRIQKGDNIATALKNIPGEGRRPIIRTIYFNPEKETQTNITTSPDSTLWNGPKKKYAIDSQKKPSNLISKDTIYVPHQNAYISTPIDTTINKDGILVVTYKSGQKFLGGGAMNINK